MYLVGLHNDEDSGACLLKDGKLLDAVNEERFNRTKLYKGVPERSLQYLLERHGIGVGDIERFAYGWYGKQNDFGDYSRRLARRVFQAVSDGCSETVVDERLASEFGRDELVRVEFEQWMSTLGVQRERIFYFDHHGSHAWSAFSCSPFDAAHVFTFDGRGDLKSCSASIADRDGGVKEQHYGLTFDSLGFLYGQITHYLGFTPHRHEGKVTGLAAYGEAKETLPLYESMIRWTGDEILANLARFRPFYTNLYPEIVAQLADHNREDIAAGLQQHCENLVAAYVAHWIQKSGRPDIRQVCLAGGLFANVRINQRVGEIEGVDDLYVFPHMGDGGLPVGAAARLNFELTGQSKIDMQTVHLGPSFDDDSIAHALGEFADDISIERCDDIVGRTVEDLLDSRLVGFFQGRMEFGPRALGARSILFHARDDSANSWLNSRLKRTEFMPFAPVTPRDHGGICYVGWTPGDVCSRMMTRTYKCTPDFRERHPAVVHVDGTARPQIVSADLNGIYYDVVKTYCDRSGDKALINTSFNQHEDPIVCSPKEAIVSLLRANVDVLIIGNFRVVRNDSVSQ